MSSRFTRTVFAAASLLLGACTSQPTRDELAPTVPNVRPASSSSMSACSRSHQRWAGVRRSPLSAEQWIAAEALVLDELTRTATAEPACPLFATLRGRVALELALAERDASSSGRRLETAKSAFEASLAGHSEWVPGWLGLAELHVLVGQPKLAREALDRARAALASLERLEAWTLSSATAEHYADDAGRGSASADEVPALSPQQSMAVVVRWIDEEASWCVGTTDVPEVAAADALVIGRWRRLRARIELQDARIEAAEVDYDPARAVEVLAAYDEALRWDPELSEARIELALWWARAGEPERALGLAEPFLDGRYPLLTFNPALLKLAARAQAELFARGGTLAAFHDAVHYFERLGQLRGDDVEVQIAYARHLVAGAEQLADATIRADARTFVSALDPGLPERAELLARLEAHAESAP